MLCVYTQYSRGRRSSERERVTKRGSSQQIEGGNSLTLSRKKRSSQWQDTQGRPTNSLKFNYSRDYCITWLVTGPNLDHDQTQRDVFS